MFPMIVFVWGSLVHSAFRTKLYCSWHFSIYFWNVFVWHWMFFIVLFFAYSRVEVRTTLKAALQLWQLQQLFNVRSRLETAYWQQNGVKPRFRFLTLIKLLSWIVEAIQYYYILIENLLKLLKLKKFNKIFIIMNIFKVSDALNKIFIIYFCFYIKITAYYWNN